MSVDRMKSRFRDAPGVMISVHRGCWGPLPENSAAAVQAASAFDVVEVDVRLDALGDAYFMHDRSLLRMTGWDEAANGVAPGLLDDLRLKSGAGGETEPLTAHSVPRLEDGFAAICAGGAIFDLDVKLREDLVAVATQVSALGMAARATLKIDVETRADIAELKSLEAAFDIMVMAKVRLECDADLDIVRALKDADLAVVEVVHSDVELLRHACKIGGASMRVGVLTIDPAHSCGLSDTRAKRDPDAVCAVTCPLQIRA